MLLCLVLFSEVQHPQQLYPNADPFTGLLS